jgi:O-6-methylguanine DNA methyltransferase
MSDFKTDIAELLALSASKNTSKDLKNFNASYIESPLGSIVAIGDHSHLYYLDFVDSKKILNKLLIFKNITNAIIKFKSNTILENISRELDLYFINKLNKFSTPVKLVGSDFQRSVWAQLLQIPYGHTSSYGQIAKNLQHDQAFRAVANANAANKLAIIVPCHRVINSNNQLGGYAGGLERKRRLLSLERTNN